MPQSTAPLVTPVRTPLATIVHALRGLGDLGARGEEVDALLDGVTLPLEPLLPHLPFARGRYTRTLVYRDDRFELLLLAWSPGAATPVHDHAGQDCWFVPLAGAFDLDDYALLDGGEGPGAAHLMPLRSRRVHVGEADHRDRHEGVHAVTLASPLGLSLHVYARPVDHVLVYDLLRGASARRSLVYDAVAPSLGA